MTTFLIISAIIVVLIGLALVSKVSAGVGIVGCACLLGIFARMQQAHDHHKEVIDRLGVIFRQILELSMRG